MPLQTWENADVMTNNEPRPVLPGQGEIVATICRELRKIDDAQVELTEDTDITTDLNVDSVAVMDLLMELEERYDVSVPLNELGDVRTVGQLARLVSEMAATGREDQR